MCDKNFCRKYVGKNSNVSWEMEEVLFLASRTREWFSNKIRMYIYHCNTPSRRFLLELLKKQQQVLAYLQRSVGYLLNNLEYYVFIRCVVVISSSVGVKMENTWFVIGASQVRILYLLNTITNTWQLIDWLCRDQYITLCNAGQPQSTPSPLSSTAIDRADLCKLLFRCCDSLDGDKGAVTWLIDGCRHYDYLGSSQSIFHRSSARRHNQSPFVGCEKKVLLPH